MRWWYLAASAGVLVVAATMVLSASRPTPPKSNDAGLTLRCTAVRVDAAASGPETANLVVHAEPGITVELDGHSYVTGVRVLAGRHHFRASAPGLGPFEVTATVAPFSVVVVDARRDGPVVVAVLAGAACDSCGELSHAPLTLTATGGQVPSLEASARALAQGQWATAAKHLRELPEAVRRQPSVAHQLLAASTLAGVRLAQIDGAGAAALRTVIDERLPKELEQRQLRWVARWNAETERFARVAAQFSSSSPGVVSAASERMDALSVDFARASEAQDFEAEADLLDGAVTVERALGQGLAALHPADCAWSARVQSAFDTPVDHAH